jgi:hypothetical protein
MLLRLFEAHPGTATLYPLASMGSDAPAAGASVVKYVRAPNVVWRADAARTLGYIGYTGAIPDLQSLLDDGADWKLVYAAAEALGRLKAQTAAPGRHRGRSNRHAPHAGIPNPVSKSAAVAGSAFASPPFHGAATTRLPSSADLRDGVVAAPRTGGLPVARQARQAPVRSRPCVPSVPWATGLPASGRTACRAHRGS